MWDSKVGSGNGELGKQPHLAAVHDQTRGLEDRLLPVQMCLCNPPSLSIQWQVGATCGWPSPVDKAAAAPHVACDFLPVPADAAVLDCGGGLLSCHVCC